MFQSFGILGANPSPTLFHCNVEILFKFCFYLQYSWKLLHPTDPHQSPNCPPEAEEYERVSLKMKK